MVDTFEKSVCFFVIVTQRIFSFYLDGKSVMYFNETKRDKT